MQTQLPNSYQGGATATAKPQQPSTWYQGAFAPPPAPGERLEGKALSKMTTAKEEHRTDLDLDEWDDQHWWERDMAFVAANRGGNASFAGGAVGYVVGEGARLAAGKQKPCDLSGGLALAGPHPLVDRIRCDSLSPDDFCRLVGSCWLTGGAFLLPMPALSDSESLRKNERPSPPASLGVSRRGAPVSFPPRNRGQTTNETDDTLYAFLPSFLLSFVPSFLPSFVPSFLSLPSSLPRFLLLLLLLLFPVPNGNAEHSTSARTAR